MPNKCFNSKDENIFSVEEPEFYNGNNGEKRLFHLIRCQLDFNQLISNLFSYDYLKELFITETNGEEQLKKVFKEKILEFKVLNKNKDSYLETVKKNNVIIGNIGEIFSIFCFKNIQYNHSDISFHKTFYNLNHLHNVIESHQGLDYVGWCEKENKILILDIKTITREGGNFNKSSNIKSFWSDIKETQYVNYVIENKDEKIILESKREKTIFGFFIFQKNELKLEKVSETLKEICIHEKTNKCKDYCKLVHEAVVFHFKIESFDDVIKAFESYFCI